MILINLLFISVLYGIQQLRQEEPGRLFLKGAGETFNEPVRGVRDGVPLPVGEDIEAEAVEEQTLFIRRQPVLRLHYVRREEVRDGAERLDEVVRQIKRVKRAVMVDTEGGDKAVYRQ